MSEANETIRAKRESKNFIGIDSWDLSEAKIKDTLPLSNHRYDIL